MFIERRERGEVGGEEIGMKQPSVASLMRPDWGNNQQPRCVRALAQIIPQPFLVCQAPPANRAAGQGAWCDLLWQL